jgi:hypothetical protein
MHQLGGDVMPDLEFTCPCGKSLGTIAQDAGHAELEQFRESLEEKGYFAVHHAGWFCSKACAEAFLRRVSEPHAECRWSKATSVPKTINITITPDSRVVRSVLMSALVLMALIWRMLGRGDHLLSAKVGLACCIVILAGLGVWAVQRLTGQRWSWFAVFLAVCAASVAVVWSLVYVLNALRLT